jgi:Flp pilus assembly pilin Flp
MIVLLSKFRRDFSGSTSIEYMLIASIIAIAAVAAYQSIGNSVNAKMQPAVAALK